MVPKCLTDLLGEIDQMDADAFPPNSEFDEKTDRILGDCPTFERKVFALGQHYHREQHLGEVNLRFSPDPDENDLTSQIARHSQCHDTLMELFWFLIRDLEI